MALAVEQQRLAPGSLRPVRGHSEEVELHLDVEAQRSLPAALDAETKEAEPDAEASDSPHIAHTAPTQPHTSLHSRPRP